MTEPHRIGSFRHVPHPHIARRREQGPVRLSFNNRFAAWGTRVFGSMPTFYVFVVYGALGAVWTTQQTTLLYWSNWIQLWSLPLIMVGMVVLGAAADRRAQQTFDDVDALLHQNEQLAAHLAAQDVVLAELAAAVAGRSHSSGSSSST